METARTSTVEEILATVDGAKAMFDDKRKGKGKVVPVLI
jgi:predicted NUDIX family NTP pyrophosphohydrolase